MDTVYAYLLTPLGRAVLLSLIIGGIMQPIKLTTPQGTWLRAMLPTIPVLIGLLAAIVPGILIGEAKLILGMGAGALSSSAFEIWDRYKAHAENLALGKLGVNPNTPPPNAQPPNQAN